MNIYKISQTDVNDYDTYSDAVVIAANADDAAKIHPSEEYNLDRSTRPMKYVNYRVKHIPLTDDSWPDWTNDPAKVKVEYIGLADWTFSEETVVCASFHAG